MTCHKTAFESYREATENMKYIKKASSKSQVPTRAYKCECGKWHLTHLKAKNVKKKRWR